jgi:hypothetical protein
MIITTASFPTPSLALRSVDPGEQRRIRRFAVEQAAVAEASRTRLIADRWRSASLHSRHAMLAALHTDLIRWRHSLALRAPHRLGVGLPLDASRYLLTLRDGGANYDRVGYLGRLRDGAAWDPHTRTYRGGRTTPAFTTMLGYGQRVADRFAAANNRGDVLDNGVVLPDGRTLRGNMLMRGEAARRIAADLVRRVAGRGGHASRMETGGDPVYLVTAGHLERETMFRSALDLLAAAEPGDLGAWQAARYLLYQAPVTKKGSDAVTRTFVVVVGAVLLGRPPVLDEDVDLRCLVLGQRAATILPSDPDGTR